MKKIKVLLMGDSIQIGYQNMVKDLLSDKYEVYFTEDNGRFVQYSYWLINQFYKEHGDFDILHFNNGYWDMNIEHPMKEALNSVEEYTYGLRKIVNYAKQRNTRVIFATTTPVYDEGSSNDNTGVKASITYKNEWVTKYNEAAVKLMKELDVEVNDLYNIMLQGEKYYKCEDMLHLSDEGSLVCAKQIIKILEV